MDESLETFPVDRWRLCLVMAVNATKNRLAREAYVISFP